MTLSCLKIGLAKELRTTVIGEANNLLGNHRTLLDARTRTTHAGQGRLGQYFAKFTLSWLRLGAEQ